MENSIPRGTGVWMGTGETWSKAGGAFPFLVLFGVEYSTISPAWWGGVRGKGKTEKPQAYLPVTVHGPTEWEGPCEGSTELEGGVSAENSWRNLLGNVLRA